MAIDHHKCKKDSTHKAIADEFKLRGYSILDTSPLKNACDFVATNGEKTYFVECKGKNGKLSDGEITFQHNFKAPVYNLIDPKDVVNLLEYGLYDCPVKIERQLNKYFIVAAAAAKAVKTIFMESKIDVFSESINQLNK